jgi:4-alpha-glucanotransferase
VRREARRSAKGKNGAADFGRVHYNAALRTLFDRKRTARAARIDRRRVRAAAAAMGGAAAATAAGPAPPPPPLPERSVLLHFTTSYMTRFGENVVVAGEGAALGAFDLARAPAATCRHAGEELVWEAVVAAPLAPSFTYCYAVVDERRRLVKWAARAQTLALPADLPDGAVVDVADAWASPGHPAHLLSTAAFTRAILGGRPVPPPPLPPAPAPPAGAATLRFQVWDWEVRPGQEVCVSGGAAPLGSWQLGEAVAMREAAPGCFEAEVVVPLAAFPVTYKYAVRGAVDVLSLEHGESRVAALPAGAPERAPALLARHDGHLRRERRWRGAGVAVPVFALRTSRSVGCGEFADVAPLARWCAAAGLSLLQLLPVSDTRVRGTWRDSYPYSALCVFALHPMYLSLDGLAEGGGGGGAPLPPAVAAEVAATRAALDLPEVDYEATVALKLRLARAVFDARGAAATAEPEFLAWSADNAEWLRPYSVFCFLAELFGTAEHWTWGALARPSPAALDRLCAPGASWAPALAFSSWLQWQLHRQLAAASAAAAAAGVALKGDLPIGVDKASVDAWAHPRLFRMTASTGAPPDYFDPGGQNWGFPTYDWGEMARDGYAWWRRRLAHMGQYFHAYRIDHVLGFFRIWELPGDAKLGLLGRFRPSAPLWRRELEGRGIWDFDRLCDPYATPALLEAELGNAAAAAATAERFFRPGPGARLLFKPEWAGEAALCALAAPPGAPAAEVEATARLRKALLALRHNVVLLRDGEDPDRFYPRIGAPATTSFAELPDPAWREELARAHEDYFFGGRSDAMWREQALKTLPALQGATDMLVCGEDLGMIPACVPPVLAELGVVGLRVQRMPAEAGAEFGDPAGYPYAVVASPSSHDTSTLRAWYEGDAARRERFARAALGLAPGAAPAACSPAVAAAVAEQHLASPAILAVFPLQDLFALSAPLAQRPAEEETINDPTNPEHYWRYRMHVTVEELAADAGLLATLRALLAATGRDGAGAGALREHAERAGSP